MTAMSRKMVGLALLLALFAQGCSIFSVSQSDAQGNMPNEGGAYSGPDKIQQWHFSGRLAVSQKKEAWSASIDWRHLPSSDEIKLSGPLGQGTALVRMDAASVSIDRGDGKVQSSTDPQQFISEQLGLFVPLSALRYWVLGVPAPLDSFVKFGKGFNQLGWLVEFDRMRPLGKWLLPEKMTVLNRQAKLKLIVDQWDIENAGAK